MDRMSSFTFRTGLTSRNRIVVPPMASGTATQDGHVTDETLAHYGRLAQARAGILFVEYSFVHPSGRSEENQLGAHADSCVAGLSRLARTIQGTGAIAGIQLTHAGGKTLRALTGGALESPSGIRVPTRDRELENPDPVSPDVIDSHWRKAFVAAAGRAQNAGFEIVELHAAHGYGLNQWLSPITNARTDSYGGSVENNARLLLEIAQDIRSAFPRLLLAVRLPGRDFIEGGLDIPHTQWIARQLEGLGCDLIDVSSGIGGWRRPRDRQGEGYLVDEAAHLQSGLKIPVIGVGGIETAACIDALVGSGTVAFAAVGRAILEGRYAGLGLELASVAHGNGPGSEPGSESEASGEETTPHSWPQAQATQSCPQNLTANHAV